MDRRVRGLTMLMCAFLVLTFAIGGSARGDILGNVLLWPVAFLAMGVGLSGLQREMIRPYRYLLGLVFGAVGLTLLQLVPLPPGLWSHLPGRGIVAEVGAVAGLGSAWRAVSLVPRETWGSLFAMAVPIAMLLLGMRAAGRLRILLPVMIAIGIVSGLIALLQLLGPSDGPLYFYPITNAGAAVGLFANRNHQAVLLATMFPMLAAFASLRWHFAAPVFIKAMALIVATMMVPLIFITGSRLGLIVGGVGVVSTLLFYRPPVESVAGNQSSGGGASRVGGLRRRWLMASGLLAFAALLGTLSVLFDRGEAFQRIAGQGAGGDTRFESWGVIARMVAHYFPFGTGAGTFVEAYQLHEPRALLTTSYLNHAHNDWLEVVLTHGAPGAILLVCGVALFFVRTAQVARAGLQATAEAALFARLGLVLVVQFAIASGGDYPLRTPSLAAFFALAVLWAATPLLGNRDQDEAPVERRGPAEH
ncbi:O-antigen ligase family protein [Sphingomonas sp.]|uniref:O-antigen ligase family protein n=1 Tax=Sphingomonas sp. TaxID=28214 RepID=UPI002DD665BA|nr:O-antigen ligase family protein [Sphingomonas sp.]